MIGGYAGGGAGRRGRRNARCSPTTTISSAVRSLRFKGRNARRACAILFRDCKPLRAVAQLPWQVCRRLPVVSRGELEHLKRAGLAGIPMTFAGPGKRDDELEAGIAAGATISVESEGEAGARSCAGETRRHPAQVAVRVNSAVRDRERPRDARRAAKPVRQSMRERVPAAGRGPASKPASTGAASTSSPLRSASTLER